MCVLYTCTCSLLFHVPHCARIKFHEGFRYPGNECLFVPETCVFAYLGLALFSFRLMVKPAFVIWSIVSLIYSHLNIPYLRVYLYLTYMYIWNFLPVNSKLNYLCKDLPVFIAISNGTLEHLVTIWNKSVCQIFFYPGYWWFCWCKIGSVLGFGTNWKSFQHISSFIYHELLQRTQNLKEESIYHVV